MEAAASGSEEQERSQTLPEDQPLRRKELLAAFVAIRHLIDTISAALPLDELSKRFIFSLLKLRVRVEELLPRLKLEESELQNMVERANAKRRKKKKRRALLADVEVDKVELQLQRLVESKSLLASTSDDPLGLRMLHSLLFPIKFAVRALIRTIPAPTVAPVPISDTVAALGDELTNTQQFATATPSLESDMNPLPASSDHSRADVLPPAYAAVGKRQASPGQHEHPASTPTPIPSSSSSEHEPSTLLPPAASRLGSARCDPTKSPRSMRFLRAFQHPNKEFMRKFRAAVESYAQAVPVFHYASTSIFNKPSRQARERASALCAASGSDVRLTVASTCLRALVVNLEVRARWVHPIKHLSEAEENLDAKMSLRYLAEAIEAAEVEDYVGRHGLEAAIALQMHAILYFDVCPAFTNASFSPERLAQLDAEWLTRCTDLLADPSVTVEEKADITDALSDIRMWMGSRALETDIALAMEHLMECDRLLSTRISLAAAPERWLARLREVRVLLARHSQDAHHIRELLESLLPVYASVKELVETGGGDWKPHEETLSLVSASIERLRASEGDQAAPQQGEEGEGEGDEAVPAEGEGKKRKKKKKKGKKKKAGGDEAAKEEEEPAAKIDRADVLEYLRAQVVEDPAEQLRVTLWLDAYEALLCLYPEAPDPSPTAVANVKAREPDLMSALAGHHPPDRSSRPDHPFPLLLALSEEVLGAASAGAGLPLHFVTNMFGASAASLLYALRHDAARPPPSTADALLTRRRDTCWIQLCAIRQALTMCDRRLLPAGEALELVGVVENETAQYDYLAHYAALCQELCEKGFAAEEAGAALLIFLEEMSECPVPSDSTELTAEQEAGALGRREFSEEGVY